ncbi:MAG: hypothetical protein H6865_08670 [Rhodospirillales bacterium]|nr:hypothetical protein [Alphaproteobacteria bacterium]MCB9987689.1 hypothetical protein [Rhodospirillales bacterium]USO08013.1 MAG: hypothetical protein H6866_01995 [Rhodospirillales bacterium]
MSPSDRDTPATPPATTLLRALDALPVWSGLNPFFLDCGTTTAMFAPTESFYFEIPDAPLPSLGGSVAGHLILEAFAPANDHLPLCLEDSLL